MTGSNPALESITEAERLVRTSMEGWSSISLPAIEFCEASLEESASRLREAIASIGRAGANEQVAAFLRTRVHDFRNNVTSLERLVSISAAFFRGVPDSIRITHEYRPGGELRVLATSESPGIQA